MEHIFGVLAGADAALLEQVARAAVARALHKQWPVAEVISRSDLRLYTFATDGRPACQRLHEEGDHAMAWVGHIAAPGAPLWPEPPGILAAMSDGPRRTKTCDGLYAFCEYDGSRQRLSISCDPVGMFPVYVLRLRAGWVFSSSLDLLLWSSPVCLHVDERAVAELLYFGYCLGDRTLVREIVRAPQGQALVLHLEDFSEHCDRRYRYASLANPPLRNASDEVEKELARRLSEAMSDRLRHPYDNVVFLSGGLDSRTICATLNRKGQYYRTFTTYNDSGTMADPDAAHLVAAELGVSNHFYPLPPDYFARLWRATLEAIDFATPMHVWLSPLAQSHPAVGAVNHDGLGALYLKGLLVKPNDVALAERGELHLLAMDLFGRSRFGETLALAIDPQAANEWKALALLSLEEQLEQFEGHRQTATFFFLANRTRRAIAASPTLLLEQRLRNTAPLLDHRPFEVALSISPEALDRGALYRRVIGRLSPGLESLPSSLDKEWPASSPRRPAPRYAVESLSTFESLVSAIREMQNWFGAAVNWRWLDEAQVACSS